MDRSGPSTSNSGIMGVNTQVSGHLSMCSMERRGVVSAGQIGQVRPVWGLYQH